MWCRGPKHSGRPGRNCKQCNCEESFHADTSVKVPLAQSWNTSLMECSPRLCADSLPAPWTLPSEGWKHRCLINATRHLPHTLGPTSTTDVEPNRFHARVMSRPVPTDRRGVTRDAQIPSDTTGNQPTNLDVHTVVLTLRWHPTKFSVSCACCLSAP